MEYLYTKDVLESTNLLTRRNYKEFTNLIGYSTPEESDRLSEEYKNETSLRPFKVNDDRKNSFSEAVQEISDPEVFKGFKPTIDFIDLIAAIISR